MSKAFIVFCVLTLCAGFSCNNFNQEIKKDKLINKYIRRNFNSYSNEYNIIKKYIVECSKSKVSGYVEKQFLGWHVDSLILFNQSRTKLYTTLNTIAPIWMGGSSDLVQELYGVKINNEWLIFMGYNLIAMREGYKRNAFEPFSLQELSYVAHEQLFRQYISIINNDIIIHSDRLDKNLTPDFIGGSWISSEGSDEEKYLRYWHFENSKILDSIEYKEVLLEYSYSDSTNIKMVQGNGLEEISLFNNDLIFDSQEWKDYMKERCNK